MEYLDFAIEKYKKSSMIDMEKVENGPLRQKQPEYGGFLRCCNTKGALRYQDRIFGRPGPTVCFWDTADSCKNEGVK